MTLYGLCASYIILTSNLAQSTVANIHHIYSLNLLFTTASESFLFNSLYFTINFFIIYIYFNLVYCTMLFSILFCSVYFTITESFLFNSI